MKENVKEVHEYENINFFEKKELITNYQRNWTEKRLENKFL